MYIEPVMSAYFTDESMMVLASNQSVSEVRSVCLESKINRQIEYEMLLYPSRYIMFLIFVR